MIFGAFGGYIFFVNETQKSPENACFLGDFVLFLLGIVWVKILTHTLTHTPKCAESAGEFQTGISGAFLIIVWSGLHYLCHEAAHLRWGIILHLSGGVGIGSEGESGIVVAQHGGHRFDIHTVLESQGCEGMAEVMESDVWQISILQYLLVDVYHTVRVIHFSCGGRGKHIGGF